ncbi:hypothetical protein [Advenella mimigardefordensis]|uniref:hypothetical protein n=1 Tax=Advenella mimigardefordensis TaxID=302406 RepID=UPI00130EBE70|nr:hypothetical protein [Advenella mimigardefordensis]
MAILAMLCIAGPQAAFLLAVLALAGRRYLAGSRVRQAAYLHIEPDGRYRLCRSVTSPDTTTNDHRVLLQYWQGPWWFTLMLRDPYFPHARPTLVTVWSFGQSEQAWRRFCVLVQASQWVPAPGAVARLAI